jgi:predicted HTH transcriptional regulator
MYETNPLKACDPVAVASALSLRNHMGQTGNTGLSELQQKIYQIIEKHGKITKDGILKILNLKSEELEQQFATLRHCELVRAFKEGDKIYFIKWETKP